MKASWDEFELLFSGDKAAQNKFIWVYGINVDWREYDDEIPRYFSAALDEGELSSGEYDADAMVIPVSYGGKDYKIKLEEDPGDRYRTIRGMRDIIKDKYTIKLFEISYMSDTHSFLILPNDMWQRAEAEYPGKVKELFMDITDKLDFP